MEANFKNVLKLLFWMNATFFGALLLGFQWGWALLLGIFIAIGGCYDIVQHYGTRNILANFLDWKDNRDWHRTREHWDD